jgi:flagellar hook-associated protein 2
MATSATSSTTNTAATATRSLVTALGAGSGIDMVELANNLAEAQFAGRTDRLTAKSELLDRQISTASNLKSMLLSLATSLGDRVRQGDLSPQPQIANGAVAQASLSGSSQPKGTYSLEVTARAAAQTLASPAYAASTDLVGSGSLKLRFGTVSGGSFTEDTAHTAVDIEIAAGSTLAQVAAAINGKNAGVTAYVAQTVDGAQLVLKGAEGAKSGFVLEATETVGDEGLANLAWNASTPNTPPRLLTSAVDAAFKIDGLPMTSSSNTVTDAIPGVTLKLTGTNTGAPTNITFGNPAAAITTAMQDLTGALNEVASALKEATDPKTGDLARDPGARAMQRAFATLAGSILMPGAAEGAPNTLADLGLSTQRDGSFVLDATRLAATLARDPEAVAAMFTTGVNGVYAKIDDISRAAGKISDPGTLAGSIARYTEQLADLDEDQAKIAEQQETMRARLISRFAVSEKQIGAMNSTLSFLKNQIAAWNKSTS